MSRIDPAWNKVSWAGGVGPDPTAVAVGEGTVWVAGGDDGTVVRVDPDGPRKASGSRPGAARQRSPSPAGRCGRRRTPETAHRGGTLRAFILRVPESADPDRLAPSGRVHDMGDVLARFARVRRPGRLPAGRGCCRRHDRRRAGHDRAAAEPRRPELRVHAPSRLALLGRDAGPDGGLQGVDGALLTGTRGLSPAEEFPPLYAGIVGARQCMRPRARCDLSRGIEANAEARTITIHLTTPDPDFLSKLTGPVRVRRAGGQPGSRDDRPPAARHWSVPRRRVGRGARRDVRAQPLLRLEPGALPRRGLCRSHRAHGA